MKIGILLLALGAFFMFSCGGNDLDCEDTNAVNAASTSAFQAVNAAVETYNSSQRGESDCETLKDAYEEFIDDLEDIGDCGLDITTQLQDARANLANLPCN